MYGSPADSIVSNPRERGRALGPIGTAARVIAGSVLILVPIATALTYVTPIDAGAIWLFFGVSLVVGAVRGDAGCEAVAIANAIFRRRERTGCVVFLLVDSLEARSGPAAHQR